MLLVEKGHRVAVWPWILAAPEAAGVFWPIKPEWNGFLRTLGRLSGHRPPVNPGRCRRKTTETMLVCEAAVFDVIIVETVGVGSLKPRYLRCGFFLVLMLAGAGDELQGIKKGL